MKEISKLEKFLKNELLNDLSDVMITKHHNTYRLFKKYEIFETPDGYFQVKKNDQILAQNFNNIKNAVIWCTFDKSSQFVEAKKVRKLDATLESVLVETQLYKLNIKKTMDDDTKLTQLIKLQEAIRRRNGVLSALKYLSLQAKTIQNKKFESKNKPVFKNRR